MVLIPNGLLTGDHRWFQLHGSPAHGTCDRGLISTALSLRYLRVIRPFPTQDKGPAPHDRQGQDPTPLSHTKVNMRLRRRYNLVNSLFDQLITFRLGELQSAVKAIHEAEAAIAKNPNDKAKAKLAEARQQLAALPVTEAEANNPDFAKIFEKKRKKATDVVPQRQAEVEQTWDSFAREHYSKIESLANQARDLTK